MAKKAKKKTTKPAVKKSSGMAAKAKTSTARKVKRAASKKPDPLNRKQYSALSPMLVVRNIRKAVEFYTEGLGFKLRGRMMDAPGGVVLHAELKLRDATLMLSPENPAQHALSAQSIGNTPATLYILVDNVDDVYRRAVAAGGQTLMPVTDMFWGDRCCMIADPEGNKWMIATHKREVTEKQMRQEMERQMQTQAAGGPEASAGSESEY